MLSIDCLFVCLFDWGFTSYSRVFTLYDNMPAQWMKETTLHTLATNKDKTGQIQDEQDAIQTPQNMLSIEEKMLCQYIQSREISVWHYFLFIKW